MWSGLFASIARPRMRVANAICTESGLEMVAMYSQFSPPSTLLKTSLPSVPRNMVLASPGWNFRDHTTRPSVRFMRSQLSPRSLLR